MEKKLLWRRMGTQHVKQLAFEGDLQDGWNFIGGTTVSSQMGLEQGCWVRTLGIGHGVDSLAQINCFIVASVQKPFSVSEKSASFVKITGCE
jgi:hypothetical protein